MSQKVLMNRRDALKLLVGACGATTASILLSGQWVKPIVEVGVLPAHAQGSFTISGVTDPPPPAVPCSGSSPSFNVVSAIVSPPPLPGSRVDFTITAVNCTVDTTSGFALTDAAGTANFGPTTITVTGGGPGSRTITVTFTFGAISSTPITYDDVPGGC
jgi:hypothetical protein